MLADCQFKMVVQGQQYENGQGAPELTIKETRMLPLRKIMLHSRCLSLLCHHECFIQLCLLVGSTKRGRRTRSSRLVFKMQRDDDEMSVVLVIVDSWSHPNRAMIQFLYQSIGTTKNNVLMRVRR